MPNCTCETTSSWGCPMHAPKHMGLQLPSPEIRVKDDVLRDAALWREVAPLLWNWDQEINLCMSPADKKLYSFVQANILFIKEVADAE